jgi:hypothetical protein
MEEAPLLGLLLLLLHTQELDSRLAAHWAAVDKKPQKAAAAVAEAAAAAAGADSGAGQQVAGRVAAEGAASGYKMVFDDALPVQVGVHCTRRLAGRA